MNEKQIIIPAVIQENMIIQEIEVPEWYILRSFPGQEKRAVENLIAKLGMYGLTNKLVEVFTPKQHMIAITDNKKTHKQESFFPGYVFVAFDIQDESEIHDIATLLIKEHGKLACVPLHEILRTKAAVQASEDAPVTSVDVAPKDHVTVIEGPYSDLNGIVETLDLETGKVVVNISVFGVLRPITLELKQIIKDR